MACDVAGETEGARGVVDSDEALPLLNGERGRGVEGEPDLFALRVEGVEVDVGYAPEGTGRAEGEERREVLVGEFGLAGAGGGGGERG